MGVDIKIIIINWTLIVLRKTLPIFRYRTKRSPCFIDILLPNTISDRIRLKRLSTQLFQGYRTVYKDIDLMQLMALILLRYWGVKWMKMINEEHGEHRQCFKNGIMKIGSRWWILLVHTGGECRFFSWPKSRSYWTESGVYPTLCVHKFLWPSLFRTMITPMRNRTWWFRCLGVPAPFLFIIFQGKPANGNKRQPCVYRCLLCAAARFMMSFSTKKYLNTPLLITDFPAIWTWNGCLTTDSSFIHLAPMNQVAHFTTVVRSRLRPLNPKLKITTGTLHEEKHTFHAHATKPAN